MQSTQTEPVEQITATSLFNLTDRLPIFSYLVSSNRVRWYRVIMRIFFQRHRELYRYQLTAQEVRDAVREAFDPEYTLEQCQSDLVALKEWGNITTIYDSSRATSIASFLSPALLYQATPEAVAIETFLAEQTRASAASGALRQGDLPRLWQSLQAIDEALQMSIEERTPARGRAIAEEWLRAFEIWNTMAREAAQYLANMIGAAQQSCPELEAFQAYKAAVVDYVHGFAQALTQYGPRIRAQIIHWTATGLDGAPDAMIAVAGPRILLLPLSQLTQWRSIVPTHPRIYVIENPQVFEEVVSHVQSALYANPQQAEKSRAHTLVCTAGWPSVAALNLLDQLIAAGSPNCLYYSGDLDVKGLQIATYLMERYPAHCIPRHIDVAAYATALQAGGTTARANDLRQLESLLLKSPANNSQDTFGDLVKTMQLQGKWAYQEGLVHLLIADLAG